MHSGGEFYLVIKQVEPGMSDQVICELRKALPNRKSILSISTATTLTIVPHSIITREIKHNEVVVGRNIFYGTNSKVEIPVLGYNVNGIHNNVVSKTYYCFYFH